MHTWLIDYFNKDSDSYKAYVVELLATNDSNKYNQKGFFELIDFYQHVKDETGNNKNIVVTNECDSFGKIQYIIGDEIGY
jgi:hypothetical protein